MDKARRDRLVTILMLLSALVFVARLPADYSLVRFILVGIIVLAGLVWLIRKR